jgi:hypothetical protein
MIPDGYHPGITVRKGNVSISKSENGKAFHFLCGWAFHFFLNAHLQLRLHYIKEDALNLHSTKF